LDAHARGREYRLPQKLSPDRDELLGLFVFVVDARLGVVLYVVFVVLFVLFFFFVVIFGKDDEVHGMNLCHFKLGVTFAAAHNFPFFDFVFIQVDVRVTFRALGHGNLSFQSSLQPDRRII
jgi:hypothetical protein